MLKCIGLVIIGLISVAALDNGLYVCNQSGNQINVAYAEQKDRTFTTHGWKTVKDEECGHLTSMFSSEIYYIYAVDVKGKSWEANHAFCVNNQKDFDIPFADNTVACTAKNFFSVWIPYLAMPVFPDHYEVVIGPNNIGLNHPRAER